MDSIFFDSWQALSRTVVIGALAYAGLIVMLRVSGRRTLSKMNAFDLVVTVSLGSVLATILLNKDVTLAQGILAFALLIGMQFGVTWLSVRVSWFRKIITGEPALLFYENDYLRTSLLKARVTEEEIWAAARATGVENLAEVKAVILETDGSFSVIKNGEISASSSLQGVKVP